MKWTRRGVFGLLGGAAGAALVPFKAKVEADEIEDVEAEVMYGDELELPEPIQRYHDPRERGTVEIFSADALIALGDEIGLIHVTLEADLYDRIVDLKPFGPPRILKTTRVKMGRSTELHAPPVTWYYIEFQGQTKVCSCCALYDPRTWKVVGVVWLGREGCEIGHGDIRYDWHLNGIASLEVI